MNERKPCYRRAFWTTAALVGAINAVFLAYYFSIPISEIPTKGNHFTKGRSVPDWAISINIMNLPGYLILLPIAGATDWKAENESQRVIAMLVSHTISAFFWGAVAVLIERLNHSPRRNRQATLGSG